MIHAALDAAGVEELVVLGHSWAGALACWITLERPERVRGLVALAGATMPWPVGRKLLARAKRLKFLNDFVVRALFSPWIHLGARCLAEMIFSPQKPPPGYVGAAGVRLLGRPDRFVANAEDVVLLQQGLLRMEPRLHEIAVPTLIIHGDADRIIPADVARRLHGRIRGSRYLEPPGIGHMPHHGEPVRVVGEIERLLERIRGDRSDRGTTAARPR